MSKIEELQSKCRSMEDILTRVDQFVDEINDVKDHVQEEIAVSRDEMRKQVITDLEEAYTYVRDKAIYRSGMFNDISVFLEAKNRYLRCSVHFDCTEYAGSGPRARVFERAGVPVVYEPQYSYAVAHPHLTIHIGDICYVDGYWHEQSEGGEDILANTDELLSHWPEILEQMYERIIKEYDAYMKRTMTKATQEYTDAVCKRDKLTAVNDAMQNMNK